MPLWDEIDVAGWSSPQTNASGHFHDWLPIAKGRVLVAVGRVLSTAATATPEVALLSQSVWIALRAHAAHSSDAGELLACVGRTLRAVSTGEPLATLALGVIDPQAGRVSLATAGDCLTLGVRAAGCRLMRQPQPPLGVSIEADYTAHSCELRPRERLVLLAGPAAERSGQRIEREFRRQNAEAHRRMTAADALCHVRDACESTRGQTSTSVVVVRRR